MQSESVQNRDDDEAHMVQDANDGIEVLDNPLPRWWKWLFVAIILLSFPYFAYYHFGAPGRTLEDSYTLASAENAQLQFAEIGELKGDAATLVRYMDETSWLSVGRSVYLTNCIACHGPDGGGLVGPNLTDDHYKNVREIEDIVKVVNNGAAAGAMPAWENRLGQNERVLVAAYVASLRGTTPGGTAKGPEGVALPPWPSLKEVTAEQVAEEGAAEEGAAEEETAEEGAAEEETAEEETAEEETAEEEVDDLP